MLSENMFWYVCITIFIGVYVYNNFFPSKIIPEVKLFWLQLENFIKNMLC